MYLTSQPAASTKHNFIRFVLLLSSPHMHFFSFLSFLLLAGLFYKLYCASVAFVFLSLSKILLSFLEWRRYSTAYFDQCVCTAERVTYTMRIYCETTANSYHRNDDVDCAALAPLDVRHRMRQRLSRKDGVRQWPNDEFIAFVSLHATHTHTHYWAVEHKLYSLRRRTAK